MPEQHRRMTQYGLVCGGIVTTTVPQRSNSLPGFIGAKLLRPNLTVEAKPNKRGDDPHRNKKAQAGAMLPGHSDGAPLAL